MSATNNSSEGPGADDSVSPGHSENKPSTLVDIKLRRLQLLRAPISGEDIPDKEIDKLLVELDEEVDFGENGQYSLVAKKNAAFRMLRAGVNHSTTAVWLTISDYAFTDSRGVCWPSISTIAERVNLSTRAVIRHIDRLVDLGAIVRLKRGNGRGHSTRYQIFTNWNPSLGMGVENQNQTNHGGGDTVCSEKVTPMTQYSDTTGPKTVSAASHESIYEAGHKPSEINRSADATKSPGAGAPYDLVAPPREEYLTQVIRKHWPELNVRQSKFAKRYLDRCIDDGDTGDEIAQGLERHANWALAWNRPIWDLGSLLRKAKHREGWETRPQKRIKPARNKGNKKGV